MRDITHQLEIDPTEARRRITAWLAAGEPNYLWPEVPPGRRLAAHAEIIRATHHLVVNTDHQASLAAPDLDTARAIGIAAFESGMGPLLGYWHERGRLETSSHMAAILQVHLEHGRRRAAVMHNALLAITDGATQAGITLTVLKGAHTGRVYFPEPATRIGTDVDILVAQADLDAMQSVLTRCGFTEHRRTARPFRSEWAPRGSRMEVASLELNHADNPWSIDLHVSLDRWFVGPGPVRLGPPHTTPFALDGRLVRVLAHPTLAAYLAVHASDQPHEIQLVRLVELALVLRQDRDRIDWTALAQHLLHTDTARLAYPALELVERLFPGTVHAAPLEHVRRAATANAKRVVEALWTSGALRLPRRLVAEKFMWARGLSEHIHAIREAIWPTDDRVSSLAIIGRRARMLLSGRAGLRSG